MVYKGGMQKIQYSITSIKKYRDKYSYIIWLNRGQLRRLVAAILRQTDFVTHGPVGLLLISLNSFLSWINVEITFTCLNNQVH